MNQPETETFATRYEEILREFKITPKELAVLFDEPFSKFYKWQKGAEPRQSALNKLLEVLPELSPDYLYNGTGPVRKRGGGHVQPAQKQDIADIYAIRADNEYLRKENERLTKENLSFQGQMNSLYRKIDELYQMLLKKAEPETYQALIKINSELSFSRATVVTPTSRRKYPRRFKITDRPFTYEQYNPIGFKQRFSRPE